MKFLKRLFSGDAPQQSEHVRYIVDNSGALTIDAEALVNSAGFRRQLEAARRLKEMQNSTRGSIVVRSSYSTRSEALSRKHRR